MVVSTVVLVLVGVALLLFGRTLYWVFVAAAGFLVGFALAEHWLEGRSELVQLLVAFGAGVLGAIIGMLVQRLAFAVGGFFAGGYLALQLARHFEFGGDPNVLIIVGGILGAIVAAVIMDWAIIALASLAGAAAIVSAFSDLDDSLKAIVFVVLAVVGVAVQGRRLTARRAAPPESASG